MRKAQSINSGKMIIMIAMSELVVIATIFGAILTAVCIFIALQQGRSINYLKESIKCLKEISRDMKIHMAQLHEEHREIIGVSKESLELNKESLEVSKKILTAVTSK